MATCTDFVHNWRLFASLFPKRIPNDHKITFQMQTILVVTSNVRPKENRQLHPGIRWTCSRSRRLARRRAVASSHTSSTIGKKKQFHVSGFRPASWLNLYTFSSSDWGSDYFLLGNNINNAHAQIWPDAQVQCTKISLRLIDWSSHAGWLAQLIAYICAAFYKSWKYGRFVQSKD